MARTPARAGSLRRAHLAAALISSGVPRHLAGAPGSLQHALNSLRARCFPESTPLALLLQVALTATTAASQAAPAAAAQAAATLPPLLQDGSAHYQSSLLEELHREHGMAAAGQVSILGPVGPGFRSRLSTQQQRAASDGPR